MSKATVFISSTFRDMSETRRWVGKQLEELGYESILFENGSLSYDPRVPLERSGYEQIKRSHILMLLIAKNYGSPATDPTVQRPRGEYVSITRREYEIARDRGIPVFTFVSSDLRKEFESFASGQGVKRNRSYNSDPQVLGLLHQISKERRNNPILFFETRDQILDQFKLQLSGMTRMHVEDMLDRDRPENKVPINCFKLYWHRVDRDQKRGGGLTIEELADLSGLSVNFLRKIETRRRVPDDPVSIETFHRCRLSDLEKLESLLQCPGELRAQQDDDFRSAYLRHYRGRTRNGTRRRDARQMEFDFTTRAIVFDFDGTLTKERHAGTTWEMLWEACGLDRAECALHHRRFREQEIRHREWCNLTRDRFRDKGLTEDKVNEVASSIKLVDNVHEVLRELKHDKRITLSIVSGSVKSIIRRILGDSYELFDEVRANEMEFDRDGLISEIHSTPFDFQTKPDFIREHIIRHRQIDPLDVLFIGNSSNDAWASNSGARTLCVNPIRTDPDYPKIWTDSIDPMTSLDQIMPFVVPLTSPYS